MTSERSKGRFLTDLQRSYLHGNHEPNTQNSKYATESQIRARIKGALFELKVFNEVAEDGMLETLFEDYTRLPESAPDESAYQMKMPKETSEIEAIIGMAYRGYKLNGMDSDEFVKSILENAIRKAEADHHGVRIQDVSAELELTEDIEVHTDPLEKWQKDMPLSRSEYQELHDRLSDKLDREIQVNEMDDLIEQHLINSDD